MPPIIVMIANSFLPSKKRNYANFMRLVAVWIFDAKLLLVASSGQNITVFESLLCNETFLSQGHRSDSVLGISDRVGGTLVEFVVIFE